MNIFEVIGKATSSTERFHSEYLAAALNESAAGDRSLFEAVWGLVAPSTWGVPERPRITTEFRLRNGAGRIDAAICSDDQHNRIVGIEVKTVEESTTDGQLAKYLGGLREEQYSEEAIAMAYLTPFNRERAVELGGVEAAESLPTVREFKEFSRTFSRARHVSWLDVADIRWDGNMLWEQHRRYVRKHISQPSELQRVQQNRTLDEFFGQGPTQRFMEALRGLGIKVVEPGANIDIDLEKHKAELPRIADGLVEALGTLVRDGIGVSRNVRSAKQDAFDKRHEYLKPPFSEVHEALFRLADRNDNVWVEGKQDYGIRVAHDAYGTGVSLVRSIGASKLQIRGRR